ncbi:class I SAM-dependent methyltransferase, partial [Candidatus Latescibacterota bacterium]
MKQFLEKMWNNSMSLNKKNILRCLDKNAEAKLLDLGCDSGEWTLSLAEKISTRRIYGIEIVETAVVQSLEKGIECKKTDLNAELPFDSDFFDIVHANQVIEHIADIDHFMREIYRVLTPGGYAVISTENGSSWCNIAAAVLGWQIFSLTNLSAKRCGIGNPLAIHRDKNDLTSSWTHKTILNYLGLKELFQVYGFKNISIHGAGYFPLSA